MEGAVGNHDIAMGFGAAEKSVAAMRLAKSRIKQAGLVSVNFDSLLFPSPPTAL